MGVMGIMWDMGMMGGMALMGEMGVCSPPLGEVGKCFRERLRYISSISLSLSTDIFIFS